MGTIAFHRSLFQLSPNRRHLITNGSLPFFWLGDRCEWLLLRLQRNDVDHYIQTRAAQRFSILQVPLLPGDNITAIKNAYGLSPFHDGDVSKPDEGYFAHLDYVVLRANVLGIAVAIEIADAALIGNVITAHNAAAFILFLTRRYQDQAVMWVLGGGHQPETEGQKVVWSLIGQTLKLSFKRNQLIAYMSGTSEKRLSVWCQAEPWLDVCMTHSGSSFNMQTWENIVSLYQAEPVVPIMEGYSCAEDQLDKAGQEDGRISSKQIRQVLYASVFSGGCGFTYRNASVEHCHLKEESDACARTPWQEALYDPAAEEAHYVRMLVESRPFTVRVPDNELLVNQSSNVRQQFATRADDDDLGGDRGSYAFCYTADGSPLKVDLTRLSGVTVVAMWFDPRSGHGRWLGQFPVRGTRVFTPPNKEDWVLVLDDSSRNYPPIGHGGDRAMSF